MSLIKRALKHQLKNLENILSGSEFMYEEDFDRPTLDAYIVHRLMLDIYKPHVGKGKHHIEKLTGLNDKKYQRFIYYNAECFSLERIKEIAIKAGLVDVSTLVLRYNLEYNKGHRNPLKAYNEVL
jgi:hypothetical protein